MPAPLEMQSGHSVPGQLCSSRTEYSQRPCFRLYRSGDVVELLIPENGFISLNIPLTPLRVGTFSTRTTHPLFISQMQDILDALGINVRLSNPYQFKTKGEMLHECQGPIPTPGVGIPLYELWTVHAFRLPTLRALCPLLGPPLGIL